MKNPLSNGMFAGTLQQASRFGIVGIFSNGIFFFVFYILIQAGISRFVAATICYISAVLFSFALNKNWSFEFTGNWQKPFAKYSITYLIGYLIVITMHYYFFRFGWSPTIIQLAAIFVVTGFNFFVMKLVVFRMV